MVLSDKAIEEHCLKTPPMIEDFKKENLRRSSYDLTVGGEYYYHAPPNIVKKIENLFIGDICIKTKTLHDSQSFSIPPHAVCYVLCKEKINLPSDITARISLRMTHIYNGLLITTQPPFDPGYSGMAVVMIHNLSDKEYQLSEGERLCSIEFIKTTSVANREKAHRSVKSLQSSLSKPITSSLESINHNANSAKRKVTWLYSISIGIWVATLGIATMPNIMVYNQNKTISEIRKDIDEIRKEIALKNSQTSTQTITNAINSLEDRISLLAKKDPSLSRQLTEIPQSENSK